jgi:ribonuclease G
MTEILLIDDGLFETRAAVMNDGLLVDIQIEREQERSDIGDFFLGRVVKVLPDLDAAFVDLVPGKTGFLQARHISDTTERINAKVHEGQAILVQVIKDALGDKGPQLSCFYSLKGQNFIYRPLGSALEISKKIKDDADCNRFKHLYATHLPSGGLTVRTSARTVSDSRLEGELNRLVREWGDIQNKGSHATAPQRLSILQSPSHRVFTAQFRPGQQIIVNTPNALNEARSFLKQAGASGTEIVLWEKEELLFDATGTEEQIERALRKCLDIPSGGNITLERTEAMVVIDVNSGPMVRQKGRHSIAYSTNLEAAKEIARQIRIRNYSGIIIIDLIQMNGKGETKALCDEMSKFLDEDPVPAKVVGMTELGLLQITRNRIRKPLSTKFYTASAIDQEPPSEYNLPTILSQLVRALEREVKYKKGTGINVQSGIELFIALETHKQRIESHLGCRLIVDQDSNLPANSFRIN